MASSESQSPPNLREAGVSPAERFMSLFMHMREGVALHEVVCDSNDVPVDYRIIDLNPQFEIHTGIKRSDVIGKLATEAYGVPVAPYLEEFGAVALSGVSRTIEIYFPPLARHFSISVAPLGPRAFATIFFDITAAKQQALAIENNRLCLRALLDNLPHWAWLKDRNGRYVEVNRAFAEGAGAASPEALVGKSDFELASEERAIAIQKMDAEVIANGPRTFIEALDGTDGTRWYEVHLAPLRAMDGTVTGTTGIARDITDQRRAELAREQSERKFEQVFDLAPDPIIVATTRGDVLFANRAFEAITGYSRKEILGRSPLELGLWERPDERPKYIDLLKREGRFDSLEFTLITKSGARRHMLMAGALVDIGDDHVIITAARDITESREAEARAEAARQELAQFFSLSLDMMCIARTDGRFVRLNPAWSRVLGRPLPELQSCNFLDFVHPDDREETLRATSQLGKGEMVRDFRNRYHHADGSWRWLEWRSAPDDRGRIYAVARDVTQRQADELALRNAERQAARSREQLLSVAELAHIGHFSIDFGTNAVEWTPESYRILGYEPNSFRPTLEACFAAVHPDDLIEVQAALRAASERGEATRLQLRVVRPTGEIRHCLAILEGERGDNERPIVLGLLQDLTDIKRAEAEQLKLEQQVMQSQKLESLGVLAGGIAHDFNNLLTSILGNADLALSELSPVSPARVYLDDIEQVSRRAADLCRQMLAYSGKGKFVVQSLSLNEVVREMAYLLSVSISKKVVVKYNFFDNLPSVMADATQLRQIVMNLITNASEAIGEVSGVVTLTTGVMDCDDAYLASVVGDNDRHTAGQYVYLEVSDTGCGMDPETVSRIFDPFFTTKFTGRGLGLAAVMGIVRGHHGALRVYSEKGHGTTFKVLFPAHHSPAQALEQQNRTSDDWRAHGLVLLVDDEESIRSMGRHMLERAGFEVITAANGREAVDVFEQRHREIRLVVLDMTMPHLDGEACFRELRRISPTVKVVMTSGYNEQDVINRFVGKGLAGFIQKPYKSSDLIPKLREILEHV
jgi:PAS domain S-box-containing protein